jgi:hypothetical protein
MAITFNLRPEDYVTMLTKVSAESANLNSLKRATSSAGPDGKRESVWFSVSCNQAEAEVFLEIAREHCPGAAAAIERAISKPKAH